MLAVRAPESGPPALFNTGNRPAADRTRLPFAAVDRTSEREPPGFAAHAVKVMECRAARPQWRSPRFCEQTQGVCPARAFEMASAGRVGRMPAAKSASEQ